MAFAGGLYTHGDVAEEAACSLCWVRPVGAQLKAPTGPPPNYLHNLLSLPTVQLQLGSLHYALCPLALGSGLQCMDNFYQNDYKSAAYLSCLLSLLASDTQQSSQQEEVDLKLTVHVWQCTNLTKYLHEGVRHQLIDMPESWHNLVVSCES